MDDTIINSTAMTGGASNTFQIAINVVAIVVGLFAVVWVLHLNRTIGGRVRQALWFFIAGILCNVVAIGWSLFLEHDFIFSNITIDIHQNLMTLGMIFFIISTARFAKLINA